MNLDNVNAEYYILLEENVILEEKLANLSKENERVRKALEQSTLSKSDVDE